MKSALASISLAGSQEEYRMSRKQLLPTLRAAVAQDKGGTTSM